MAQKSGTGDSLAGPPRYTDRFDRRLLAPMMLGAILNPVNSSIIAVTLVPIAVAFGAPASQTAWLVSALYLATAIGQPVVGRLVDAFGPRPLFLVGCALVTLAGLIGVLAQSLDELILTRVILGFGTCAGYPAAMRLIRSEAARTGVASPAGVLTALSVATQTISVIGPTLGGLLIHAGGWRATFAINLPVGVLAFALGALFLPSRVLPAPDPATRRDFDLAGITLFACTLACLLVFLMNVQLRSLWLVAVAVLAAAAFTRRELRTRVPFIDLRLFVGNVPLLVTYARGTLAATISYCLLYGYTQWLQAGRGLSATAAGLMLLPLFAVGISVASATGRRPEIRAKLIVGTTVQLLGSVALFALGHDSPVLSLIVLAAVFGLPQGLVNLAVQNALYHQAEPERIGAAAGLLRTFMYLGAMLAAAAISACFGHHASTAGLHRLATVMVAAAGLLCAITLTDRSLRAVDRKAKLSGAGTV